MRKKCGHCHEKPPCDVLPNAVFSISWPGGRPADSHCWWSCSCIRLKSGYSLENSPPERVICKCRGWWMNLRGCGKTSSRSCQTRCGCGSGTVEKTKPPQCPTTASRRMPKRKKDQKEGWPLWLVEQGSRQLEPEIPGPCLLLPRWRLASGGTQGGQSSGSTPRYTVQCPLEIGRPRTGQSCSMVYSYIPT